MDNRGGLLRCVVLGPLAFVSHADHRAQPFEVFRAIERKDIMFIMEVRDRSFEVRL